jgi:hypothetical protein
MMFLLCCRHGGWASHPKRSTYTIVLLQLYHSTREETCNQGYISLLFFRCSTSSEQITDRAAYKCGTPSEVLTLALRTATPDEEEVPCSAKLAKSVRDFSGSIEANQQFIPNYGERYRYGEAIATGFVESMVNQVVSKRMVKKQQMRWTKKGAHLLLQVRSQVLNDDLRATFERWYPLMERTDVP